MAATRLIALHKNKGKSVAACLKSRTDYAQNPDKTNKGELVSSYECSPLTVDEEFMLSKRQYELVTGRRQKSDVIAYQIRQSFKPGEITAEEANKVGYELAMRFTKGKYAFIVATHTDREHIHNHIIHSMAGDAGKMLSGGQRQRISLARAILKDAPIVVLDEATAYADPENEEKMEAAIAELVKGKTLVVIAHKLPAIMNADQICVIDHGKLVAAGKHQDLIRSCPEYQKLWKAAQDSAEWKVHTAKEGA